jgi:hypothetical protein
MALQAKLNNFTVLYCGLLTGALTESHILWVTDKGINRMTHIVGY